MPEPRGPSQRTQVIRRETTDITRHMSRPNAGAGFGAIAGFLNQATDDMMEKQAAVDAHNDETALQRLELAARRDPTGVREAIRTGDYSKHIGIEMASRKAVITNAPTRLGAVLGSDSAAEFKDGFRTLPPDADPKAFTQAYIDENTKGMPTRAKHAYTESIYKLYPTLNSERAKVVGEYHSAQAVRGFTSVIQSALENGTTGDISDVYQLAGMHSAVPGTPYLKQLELHKAAAAKVILKSIGSEDRAIAHRAESLIAQPDPETGLTLLEEYSDKAPGWMEETSKAHRAVLNAKMEKFYASIDIRLANIKSGAAGDDDLYKVRSDLIQSAKKETGLAHPKFLKFLGTVSSQIAAGGRSRTLASLATSGEYIPKEDRWDVWQIQTPEQQAIHAGTYGYPKQVQEQQDHTITNGSAPEAAAMAQTVLNTMQTSRGNLPMEAFVKDKEAAMIVMGLKGVDGIDAMTERVDALRKGIAAYDGDVNTAFADLTYTNDPSVTSTVSGRSNREKIGGAGQRKFIHDQLQAMDDETKQAMGLGEWDGDVTSLNNAVYDNIVARLNQATIATHGTSQSQDPSRMWEMAKGFMYQDYETIPGPNGRHAIVLRKTAKIGMSHQGKPVQIQQWDSTHTAAWEGAKETWGVSADLSDAISTRQDDMTQKDGTLLIQRESDMGGTGDFEFAPSTPGQLYTMDEDELAMLGPLVEEWPGGREDGITRVRIKDVEEMGTTEFELHNGVIARWDNTTGRWQLRAEQIRPDGDLTPQIVKELRKAGADHTLIGTLIEYFADDSAVKGDIKKEIDMANLPADAAEALKVMVENKHPLTLTDEELDAQIIKNYRTGEPESGPKAIVQEIQRRAEGGQRLQIRPLTTEDGLNHPSDVEPGSHDAPRIPDHHPDIIKGQQETTRDEVSQLENSGVIDHETAKEAIKSGSADVALTTQEAVKTAMKRGHPMDDMTRPDQDKQPTAIARFITKSESPHPQVAVTDMTIGYGLSLYHPEAPDMLEEVGADFDKVLRGEEKLNKPQMEALNELTVTDGLQFVNKHLAGAPLTDTQKTALIKLGAMSDHDDKPVVGSGPSLINSELTRAVREGNWEAAVRIVKEKIGPADWVEAHSREMEGFRKEPYLDTVGVKTVGYGWNLEAHPVTDEEAARWNLNKENPSVPMSLAVEKHREHLNVAKADVLDMFGPDFADKHPARYQVVVDMMYNMGMTKFNKTKWPRFTGLIDTALGMESAGMDATHVWDEAADEMADSKWFRQVKRRGRLNQQVFRKGGTPAPHPMQVKYQQLADMLRPTA